jgi:hypothetical protein
MSAPAEILDLVSTRLKTVTIFANEVWGIIELEESKGKPVARLHTPSSYVILVAENAGVNYTLPVVEQKVTAVFGVVLAIDNSRNQAKILGGGAPDNLQSVRTLVRNSLLAYVPDPAYSPVEYVRGRLVRVENNVLWWQDDFRTDYYIRSQ